MVNHHRLILGIFFIFLSSSALAGKKQLPIPRFVTIKSSEANVRTGPNVRYPIRWVFVKKWEPVEVLAEFEQWRKIRDKYGDSGWIHESMLSGKRSAVVSGDQVKIIYQKPDDGSTKIVKIELEVRVELLTCQKDWCNVHYKNHKGWIKASDLWGIYPNEEFK